MRSLFYKSGFILAIFSTITMLCVLSSNTIIKHYFSIKKSIGFLSNDYVVTELRTEGGENEKLKTVLSCFQEVDEEYRLSCEWEMLKGRGICYTN